MIEITLEDPSLVLLVGPSGAGKSTFAAGRFGRHEIVSSDACRAAVCDDEAEQSVTHQAFGLLHHIVRLRMANRRLTVVDATNLQKRARRPLHRIAGYYAIPVFAIVFDVPLEQCLARNARRPHRFVDEQAIRRHAVEMELALGQIRAERFKNVFVLGELEAEEAQIRRLPAKFPGSTRI